MSEDLRSKLARSVARTSSPRDERIPRRGRAATAGLIAASALGCGSTPICPNGNCSVPGVTVVTYRFDHYPEWGFDSDSCTDLAIAKVHVQATDAAGKIAGQDVPCDYGQATFTGLAPGPYTIAITPSDAKGNSAVTAPIAGTVTAPGPNGTAMTEIDVPYTSWTGTYTGTFLFRVTWGGQACAAAAPPVVMQQLTLAVNGTAVTQVTDSGQRLDGEDPEPCRPSTDEFPQSVKLVPFGPAEFTVTGKDATNAIPFHHTFDTFVGAGISNPTLTFDVTNPPADAGVDGPMDAPMDASHDAPMDGP